MAQKLYEIIKDRTAVKKISKEIVSTFMKEASDENIDYSFTIDKDTGSIKGQNANTYFVFDTKEGTCLHEFKKALFSKELEYIKEGSEEEKQLMEDVKQFLTRVCKDITKTKYKIDSMRKTIRKVVLGGKIDKKTAPLNSIEVLTLDIADYSSVPEPSKHLLRIGKIPGSYCETDRIVQFVYDKQEESEEEISLNDILDLEKAIGNPLFDNVIAIEQGRKFLNEICVFMFVDYSLIGQSSEE